MPEMCGLNYTMCATLYISQKIGLRAYFFQSISNLEIKLFVGAVKENLPKVLMLGWEFPPVINGGLGIACHDLSAAMSALTDITMIVPKSSPGFKVKDVNLVGVNSLNLKNFTGYPSNYRKVLPY